MRTNGEEFLERLTAFLELDLQEPSEEERRQALEFFRDCQPSFDAAIADMAMEQGELEGSWAEVLDLQERWRDCFDWMIERQGGPWQIELDAPRKVMFGVPRDDRAVFTLGLDEKGGEIQVRAFDMSAWTGRRFEGDEEPPKIEPEVKIFPPGAMWFFEALEGRLKSCIRRCAYCGRRFFNASRRDQVYCSHLCRKNAGMARVREKQKGA